MAFHDKNLHKQLDSTQETNSSLVNTATKRFDTKNQSAPHRQYLYKPTPFASRIKHLSLLINLVALTAILLAGLSTWSMAIAQTTQIVTGAKSAQTNPIQLATLVRPNDLNSGGLLLPSKKPGYYVAAPRLATDVVINITGPIARTIVTQRFENPSKGWVEGIYVFPLPENSAVDTLKMQIGKRFIEGKIKPREEARKIYEQAKAEGRKASLLEQQRPNIFTNAVANIGPGETIVIQMEYQQTIKQDKGVFSLRFPMVVAPRYSPSPIIQTVSFNNNGENKSGFGQVDPVPDREKITPPVLDPETNALINPVAIKINLAAGFPLGNVTSAYHKMDETTVDKSTRTLVLKNESVPADRDFKLSWKADGKAPNAALFTQNVKGDDYILAFITPPSISAKDLPKKNREAIFIIDNSGSMAGESIVQAKLALATALARLTPQDKFNIIRFDNTYELVFPRAVNADMENISTALRFVGRLQAEGGTEMLPALSAALVDHHAKDTSRVRQVIFITDGAIGNEQQLFNTITAGRGRSRVFTIGIGSAPNSYFMTRAAELGRGTFAHIGDLSEVKTRMGEFFVKLESPVLTDLKATITGATLSDISPNLLPDLYAGEPIVLAAKVNADTSKLSGILNISGDFAGQPWEVNMDLANAAKRDGIGKLWARKRIASLESSRSFGVDIKDIDKQIETTAMDHHLVSRLTSLVAVDVKKSRPDDTKLTTKDVSVNLPKGWVFDKVYGKKTAKQATQRLQRTRALGTRAIQVAQLMAEAPSPQIAAKVASANKRKVILPQTATNAERMVILGVLLMILATTLLLISAMWRGTGNMARGMERKIAKRDFEKLP